MRKMICKLTKTCQYKECIHIVPHLFEDGGFCRTPCGHSKKLAKIKKGKSCRKCTEHELIIDSY